MHRFFLTCSLTVLCCLSATPAVAGTSLDIRLVAEHQVTRVQGSSSQVDSDQIKFYQFDSAHNVRLGEQVYYTVLVRNIGTEPVQSPSVEQALPRNTRYIAGSAVGPAARVSVSVDGGATFGDLRELKVPTSVGQTRAAEAADCTHIRWKLRHPLMPGAVAKLRFRAEFH
jgi:uncharacterized repeat protein (TIGR01451 family)